MIRIDRALHNCVLVLLLAVGQVAGLTGPARSTDRPATFITHRVTPDETLMDIARFHDLGFVELRAANPGTDPWLPEVGRELIVPTLHLEPAAGREGIVVNLADQRLYFFPDLGESAISFPLGIGRAACETPTGVTRIDRKRRNPVWVPPASIRAERPELPAAIPPGPNNPLGAYALNLGWEGYVIHGTNRPEGIGRRVSHGCLRLYPEDIERLFPLVSTGTKVTIVDQPVKLGWIAEHLYLEVHPSQRQADEIEMSGRFQPEPLPGLRDRLQKSVDHDGAVTIDWALADRVAQERRGLAVRISK